MLAQLIASVEEKWQRSRGEVGMNLPLPWMICAELVNHLYYIAGVVLSKNNTQTAVTNRTKNRMLENKIN